MERTGTESPMEETRAHDGCCLLLLLDKIQMEVVSITQPRACSVPAKVWLVELVSDIKLAARRDGSGMHGRAAGMSSSLRGAMAQPGACAWAWLSCGRAMSGAP